MHEQSTRVHRVAVYLGSRAIHKVAQIKYPNPELYIYIHTYVYARKYRTISLFFNFNAGAIFKKPTSRNPIDIPFLPFQPERKEGREKWKLPELTNYRLNIEQTFLQPLIVSSEINKFHERKGEKKRKVYIYIYRGEEEGGERKEVFAKTYPREIGLTLETVRVYIEAVHTDGQGNR